ncbi:MAG TPA: hypothetical protein VEZ88_10565 [Steroidobacteraceae bacterium]|nr:hypothetical protein [Steroidobacteraceae bacterium]
MLDELVASSAVRLLANGTVRAVVRAVAIPKIETRDIDDLGTTVSALLNTICNNIESRAERLFVSSTVSRRIDKRMAALLLRRIQQQGTALLQSIDDQLTHPPRGFTGKRRNRGPKLGVTLFIHKESRPDWLIAT